MKIWGNPVVSWRIFHNFLLLLVNKKLVSKVMGATRPKIGHAQSNLLFATVAFLMCNVLLIVFIIEMVN
jgi:hypothetical protein